MRVGVGAREKKGMGRDKEVRKKDLDVAENCITLRKSLIGGTK